MEDSKDNERWGILGAMSLPDEIPIMPTSVLKDFRDADWFPRHGIDVKSINDDVIVIEAYVGSNIANVCQIACKIADHTGALVQFDFNGQLVEIPPGDTAEAALSRWQAERDRAAKEWEESEEGRRYYAERAAEIVRRQAQHDVLMAKLATLGRDEAATVKWCADFSGPADHIGVVKNLPLVLKTLKKAGWKNNDLVGRKDIIDASKRGMARYIVGQAINCMSKGMGPHPIITRFADDYAAMTNLPANTNKSKGWRRHVRKLKAAS